MRAFSTLAISMTFALAVTTMAGCTQLGVFIDAANYEGTVYECDTNEGKTVEFCYLDDAGDELGKLIHGQCGDTSRRWPKFANFLNLGCSYSCPSHYGCNAHDGCY